MSGHRRPVNQQTGNRERERPPQKGVTGFARVIKAAGYSKRGLKATWQNESAFRQELGAAVIMVPLAVWLAESWTQLALMLMTCMVVLITELLNSAIETVVDRVGVEPNELAGLAKDIASAAVALSLTLVLMTYAFVALDRFAGG